METNELCCHNHFIPLMKFGQEWVCPIEFFLANTGSSHVKDIIPIDSRRLEAVFTNGFILSLEDPHSDDYDTCGPFPTDPDLQLELLEGCRLIEVRYVSVGEPWLLFNFSRHVWAIATIQTAQQILESLSHSSDE